MDSPGPRSARLDPRRLAGAVIVGLAAFVLTVAAYRAVGGPPGVDVRTHAEAAVSPEGVQAAESTTTSTPTTSAAPTSSTARNAPVTTATTRRKAPTTTTAPPVTQPSVSAPPTTQPFRPYDPNPLHPTWVADSSFAGGGTFVEPFGPNGDEPFAMVVQPDGKVVVAGWINTDPAGANPMAAAVLRLNSDGTRDTGFGDGGQVTWDVGRNARPEAMVLQPDGKILISGLLSAADPYGGGLLRLLPDGHPDPSFGTEGLVTTGVAGGDGLALEPDGRIVVAGWSPAPGNGVLLARFEAGGALDRTFGTDGYTRVPTAPGQGNSDKPEALARLDDGSLMLVGSRPVGSTSADTLTMRFRPDGRLDPGYHGSGIKVFDFGGFDTAIGVLSDTGGRAVIGTRAANDAPQTIARLLPTGELDPSFGDAGLVHPDSTVTAIGRAPEGRIVIATAGNYARLFRYGADGRPDPSLDGRPYRTPMPQGSYTPTAVAVDPAGRIVYAGFTWRFNNPASAPGQADTIWFVERVLPPDTTA